MLVPCLYSTDFYLPDAADLAGFDFLGVIPGRCLTVS